MPDHDSHCRLQLEGFEAISAGNFTVNAVGQVRIDKIPPSSVDLVPHDKDKQWLERALLNMGTSMFLDL
jgi:hypothetical protein